jgi:hypothetical protein
LAGERATRRDFGAASAKLEYELHNPTGNDAQFLRRQAWDYFSTHSSQRMSAFNFYIFLSSVAATSYVASFKADSNLQSSRPMLAGLLCLFAFIFWKLDQRTKTMIKIAERALKHYESLDSADPITKVFTKEEIETRLKRTRGWHRAAFWEWHLSYSDCFNLVFGLFFSVGFLGIALSCWRWMK